MEGLTNINAFTNAANLQGQKKAKEQEKTKKVFSAALKDHAIESKTSGGVSGPGSLDHLEQMLDDLHEKGEILAGEPTMGNIRQYKNALSKFLKTIEVHNYSVEEQEGILKRDFSRKKFFVIKSVNEKLDRLVAGILQGQTNQIEILRRVEEIQGLLVDLFS